MRQITIISVFIFFGIFHSKAQEMLGMVNSNYAGINGALINPSSMVDSKLYLDIAFITADVFAQNNYIYMDKRNYYFPSFFSKNPNFKIENGKSTLDYYNKRDKFLFANIRVNGPSAMVCIGRHAIGIYEGVRSAISVNHLPYHVAKFIYDGLRYEPQQNIDYNLDKLKVAGLLWGEIALSYAYIFYSNKMDFFAGGITIKKDLGIMGLYLNDYGANYYVPNDTTLVMNNLKAEYAYTDAHIFNGRTFAFDIGFTYERKPSESTMRFRKLCEQKYRDYIYKIGLSFLDIGAINFKKHATKYDIQDASTTWVNIHKYSDKDRFDQDLGVRFAGQCTRTNNFNLGLPKGVSIQFDYHYRKYWYLNSTLVQGLDFGNAFVRRPNQISFTPRYERRWFEINLPLSLYDYIYPRWGFSVRLFNLTIGTDKFGGFLSLNDFTGLDLYFSLKINFAKGSCGKGEGWRNFKTKMQKFYKCRKF
ncbi:MAG: DUF5723 family protein [Bacteroidales bacterium]|nr:DUF5723 family protein [Bacteroidales bacterium]